MNLRLRYRIAKKLNSSAQNCKVQNSRRGRSNPFRKLRCAISLEQVEPWFTTNIYWRRWVKLGNTKEPSEDQEMKKKTEKGSAASKRRSQVVQEQIEMERNKQSFVKYGKDKVIKMLNKKRDRLLNGMRNSWAGRDKTFGIKEHATEPVNPLQISGYDNRLHSEYLQKQNKEKGTSTDRQRKLRKCGILCKGSSGDLE